MNVLHTALAEFYLCLRKIIFVRIKISTDVERSNYLPLRSQKMFYTFYFKTIHSYLYSLKILENFRVIVRYTLMYTPSTAPVFCIGEKYEK